MNATRMRVLLLAAADFLALYGAILLSAYGYLFVTGDYTMEIYVKLWPIGLLFVLQNVLFRLYHGNFFYPGLAFGPVEELRRMTMSLGCSYLLFFLYLFLIKDVDSYSRIVLVFSGVLAAFFFPLFRWIAKSIMRRLNFGSIDVLILGAGHTGQLVCSELRSNPALGLNPVGFLDDNPALDDGTLPAPLLGRLSDAVPVSVRLNVGYVVFCLPVQVIPEALKQSSAHFNHILIVPDNKVFPSAWASPHDIDGFFALELQNQLLLKGPRLLKAGMEIIMAAGALLTLWPLFLVLSVLIKLTSPGPIFYRAKRLGLDGKSIGVYKFRTMHADAEQRLRALLDCNPELAREWAENFKLDRDPRITPLGSFLRKSSLDELPQFWNVLTGEMAVIGPRPIVEDERMYYGDNYEVFKRVKPGITGLWQVSGRSETTYERRVSLDMHYIMNWSVWMDFYIFLKTIKEVFFCRGAK